MKLATEQKGPRAVMATQTTIDTIVAKMRAGNYASAAKLARAQVKKNPNSPILAKLCGIALHESGKHLDAVKQLSRAAKLSPGDIEIKRYLVGALLSLGQAEKAHQALQSWLKASPGAPDLAYLMAGTLVQLERFEEAIAAADTCLSANPRHVQALALRGLARFELAEFPQALADFQQVSDAEPFNTEYLLNVGSTLNEMHRFTESRDVFARAVQLAPNDIELLTNLATLDMRQGRFAEAKSTFRKVLALKPDDVDALLQLAELSGPDDASEVLDLLVRAERAAGADKDVVAMAHLTRGRYLMTLGQSADAMQAFEISNRLRARTAPYDPTRAERDFERIVAFFSDETSHLRPAEAPTTHRARPIFVVGLPRSGTTLTELVLSAHSEVVGLGELTAAAGAAANVLDGRVTSENGIAQDYLKFVPGFALEAAAFVDKMPTNYQFIGLLAAAFPEARFINIERDPREVALSMWQVHLRGAQTVYTSRMDWIAHAANLYKRYMAFWTTLYPDRIMTLPYRDLVSDLEASSKAMADFCGLEWQPAMMAPERNKANVKTASITQARQKVHTKSLGKWRDFPDLIQPLVDTLDPQLWPDLDQ